MKSFKLLVLAVASLTLGCERIETVVAPQVEITVEDKVYKVGEKVRFNFAGDADVISYWSGEIGSDYAHREGRVDKANFVVNFETQRLDGDSRQGNQFRLFVSKSFDQDLFQNMVAVQGSNAGGNRAFVCSANNPLPPVTQTIFQNVNDFDGWIEVTDRFNWLATSSPGTWLSSGRGDISDLIDYDNPSTLVFGVKYTVKAQNDYGTGALNRLRGIRLVAANLAGQSTLFEHAAITDWALISSANKQCDRANVQVAQLQMQHSWNPANTTTETYDWAVSRPIQITPTVDMGPDRPVGIKSVAAKMPEYFEHTYSEPGTYQVIFVVKNQNITGASETSVTKTIVVDEQ